jgi:hypothetical protein
VTLSRRNLLALLHRLDVPGEIWGRDAYLDGAPIDLTVVFRAEENEPHYARRVAMFGPHEGRCLTTPSGSSPNTSTRPSRRQRI